MKPALEEPHSKYTHLYAIVRFDSHRNRFHLEHCATLVKDLASPHRAEQEASRLREVNQGKDSTDVIRTTTFVSSADS
jgi:hypothetical protein